MSELQVMTGSGGSLVLGGRRYLLKQLTIGDYGQIQAWLKQKLPSPFKVVADALKELESMRGYDPEGYADARKQLLLAAMEDSRRPDGAGAGPEQVSACLNGPEGIAMLLWLCIRKEHPDVSYETIEAAIKTENLGDIKKHLDAVNLFGTAETEDGDPFSPPQTPPAATRA